MNEIRLLCREVGPWANSGIRDFLLEVSQPDFLNGLRTGWATVSARDLLRAKEVLVFFPPVAIPQFGSILQETPTQVQAMLAEVIVILAGRDIRPLFELLAATSENLAIYLIPFVAKMKSHASAQLLFKMMGHQSEKVRRSALRAIISNRLWSPEKLVPLLNDESAAVSHLVLKYLASRRSEVTELLLVEYIKRIKPTQKNGADWLIACFKALGKCGTDQSLPFLKDTLMKGNWLSRLRASPVRHGAATALRYLDTKVSNEVLENSSRSRFPAIRNAARTACGLRVH
jgi:HEAT repeat protein